MSADMPTPDPTPEPTPITSDNIGDAIQESSHAERQLIKARFDGLDILNVSEDDAGTVGLDLVIAVIFIHYRRTQHVGTDEAYDYAVNLPMRDASNYFTDTDDGVVLDDQLRDVSPAGEGAAGAAPRHASAPAGVSTPDSPGTSTNVSP